MTLRRHLLPPAATEPPAEPDALRDTRERLVDVACRLCDEGQKRDPDRDVLGRLLDDLDTCVVDYRRELHRRKRPSR